ncbi:MAG: response regulator [Gammaproteobacteria bacterium]|nr:response regulator [Gammaproteobacteria bacterium]
MNTTSQRILVVDDELKLRELVRTYLSKEGYVVDAVEDGTAMDRYLAEHDVDLVILDLMLPGEDGLSIGRRLHQGAKRLPFIILSARGEELDKIVGLEMGADDYLSKPFNPRELLARVRSVLRRCATENQTPQSDAGHQMTFGPYHLDVNKHQLTKGNQVVPLTKSQFTLLRTFLENPNCVMNRDTLLQKTKGYDRSPLDRSVDICVGRLRQKIEEDPSNPVYLRTIWGSGYIFTIE